MWNENISWHKHIRCHYIFQTNRVKMWLSVVPNPSNLKKNLLFLSAKSGLTYIICLRHTSLVRRSFVYFGFVLLFPDN